MDKKHSLKDIPENDLIGFEEFVDGQSSEASFLPRGNAAKKDVGFEHFTFLSNDAARLNKLKDLLMDKIPFASRFEQGEKLEQVQQKEIEILKKNIFQVSNKPSSAYRRSMQDIFDSFFAPPQD